jgi:hypothetical protein
MEDEAPGAVGLVWKSRSWACADEWAEAVQCGVYNNKSYVYLIGWMQNAGSFPSSRSRCTGSGGSFVSGGVTRRLFLEQVENVSMSMLRKRSCHTGEMRMRHRGPREALAVPGRKKYPLALRSSTNLTTVYCIIQA